MATAMPEPTQYARSAVDINARIDRLPRFPLPIGTLVLMALLYFFSYYDITVIGDALPSIKTQFNLTTAQLALPVTVNLAGYVIGSYAFGNIADYLGRRKALLITLAVLTVGALLSAFAWNLSSLSAFRFIVGVGTGAQISLAATYIAELTPARIRGRFTQLNIIWAGVGWEPRRGWQYPWWASPTWAGGCCSDSVRVPSSWRCSRIGYRNRPGGWPYTDSLNSPTPSSPEWKNGHDVPRPTERYPPYPPRPQRKTKPTASPPPPCSTVPTSGGSSWSSRFGSPGTFPPTPSWGMSPSC